MCVFFIMNMICCSISFFLFFIFGLIAVTAFKKGATWKMSVH